MSEKPLNQRMYVPKAMPIRYHNPKHELNGELLEPNDPRIPKEGLPMDHLENDAMVLLLRKRIIVEVVAEAPNESVKSEKREKKTS